MTHTNTQSSTSTTSTTTVRKCGICRTPGHDRRKCPTLTVDVAPVATRTYTSPPCVGCGETNYFFSNVMRCDTCLEAWAATLPEPTQVPHVDKCVGHAKFVGKCMECPTVKVPRLPVVNHPMPKQVVGCFITSPDKSVHEATPEQFADMLLHVHDMWADDSDVVRGMRQTYRMPEVSNPTTGTVSAYTTEVCPTCKRVYSGADIISHLRTHNDSAVHVTYTGTVAHVSGNGTQVRDDAHMATLVEKAHTEAYVARVAQSMQPTYSSESEGLADTTSLTDAHVREDGKFLTVDVIVPPVGKCKCMHGEVSENVLVTSSGIEGGKAYTCTHGTTWNEVWEVTHTHARWDHLRDSHLQEQTYSDNIGLFGTNPLYAYLARQAQTRKQRCEEIAQWIRRASLKHILLQRKSDTLKVRRNATVAAAVGFESTPMGKWDGVEGSEICGLIRHTEVQIPYIVGAGEAKGSTVVVDATCTRIADWSGIYLTKAQFQYLTILMEKRVKGENLLTPAAKSLHEVVAPTSRQVVRPAPTKGDMLLQSRLASHTLREMTTLWESGNTVSNTPTQGVSTYVCENEVRNLHVLGYPQVIPF